MIQPKYKDEVNRIIPIAKEEIIECPENSEGILVNEISPKVYKRKITAVQKALLKKIQIFTTLLILTSMGSLIVSAYLALKNHSLLLQYNLFTDLFAKHAEQSPKFLLFIGLSSTPMVLANLMQLLAVNTRDSNNMSSSQPFDPIINSMDTATVSYSLN
jgi:hypothetical protein